MPTPVSETRRHTCGRSTFDGADDERAAARHRVAGVDRQVHQHLAQVTRVDRHRPGVRIELDDEQDVLADEPAQHALGLAHRGVDVEHLRRQHVLAAEREELARERRRHARRHRRCPSPARSARPGFNMSSSMWLLSVMTVRRLLKSWATPPARRPTASIFCDCRSCSSSSRRCGDVDDAAANERPLGIRQLDQRDLARETRARPGCGASTRTPGARPRWPRADRRGATAPDSRPSGCTGGLMSSTPSERRSVTMAPNISHAF